VSTKPILLAEGAGDEAFFRNLIKIRKLKSVDIRSPKPGAASGTTTFAERLIGLKAETGFEKCPVVLIVADNDEAPERSFRSIVDQIRRIGWEPPTKPRDISASPTLPHIAVLMLPWDDIPGCLETLCYTSASAQRETIAKCVERFTKCVKSSKWPIQQQSKLKMRCLIAGACDKDPNTGLQYAWSGGKRPDDLIPLTHECFDQVAELLESLPRTRGE
jgi:Protein of unknown function (DUF3226)